MAKYRNSVGAIGVSILVLAGGYAIADANDVVPGLVTDAPPKALPQPFPEAHTPQPLVVTHPVASIDSTAPMPSATAVQALADSLKNDSRVGKSTSIIVEDIATSQVLAEVQPNDPQIPASNDKVLTAAAIEYAIPADRRLVTSVTWSGSPEGQRVRLTLVAGGDMLLAADGGHQGGDISPNGYAGVGDLADAVVAALASSGVTNVDLVVDDHAFGGASIPSSWTWDAVNDGYCAPVSGLAIDIALIPGTEEDPERYLDPSLEVGKVLATRLGEQGVTVDSVTRGVAAAGEVELASVRSAPISDVVAYMVWYSENTIAEVLIKVLAIDSGLEGTTEAGTGEALRLLAEAGLDTAGIVMSDGSGFARSNRLSARAVADLIVLLAHDPDHDSLLEQFPIAALRGTLYDRFQSTEGAGVVRGKTGSLSGVTSLSGTVVTADGRWLAYSVLADGLPWGQTNPRAAIDEFVSALASCGCG